MSQYSIATGFVIGRRQLGEADRILKLFTREYGKLDVVARGVRRGGAKLASQTEPFYEVEWRLARGANRQTGMPVVTGAKGLQAPGDLHDLERLWVGHGLLELTERSFHDEEPSESWYTFLQQAFAAIPTEPGPLIWVSALARSLDQLGLTPEIPTQVTDTIQLRLADGQIGQGSGARLSPRVVKLWRATRAMNVREVLRIQDLQPDEIHSLRDFLEPFWQYHSGHQLKSLQLS